MDIVGDKDKPRSMREKARIWFASEYIEFICKRHETTNPKSSRWHRNKKPRELDDDIRLLEKAARVRQDAAEFAHIMLLKKKIGKKYRLLNFSVDRDTGVSSAFLAVFKNEVQKSLVRIADVTIAKNESHPRRLGFVTDGNREFERAEHLMRQAGFLPGDGDQAVTRPKDGAIEYFWKPSLEIWRSTISGIC